MSLAMTNGPTQISFVRHAEVHNPDALYYGRMPGFALSLQGRRQARHLGQTLADLAVSALYSSPLLRARQTAREISACLGPTNVRFSDLLIEVHSPFDGQPLNRLEALHWDLYSGVPAPFEQPADLQRRIARFIARVRRRHAGQHVVAVTHGDLVAFTFLWARGAPLTSAQKGRLHAWGMSDDYPAHTSVTTLTFTTPDPDEIPGVTYLNPQCAGQF